MEKKKQPVCLMDQLKELDVEVVYRGDTLVVILDGVKQWESVDPYRTLRKDVVGALVDAIRDTKKGFKPAKDTWVSDVTPVQIFERKFGSNWYHDIWTDYDFQVKGPTPDDVEKKANILLNRLKRRNAVNRVITPWTGLEAVLRFEQHKRGMPLQRPILVNQYLAKAEGLTVGSLFGPVEGGVVTYQDLIPYCDMQQLECICIVHRFGKKSVPQIHPVYEHFVATPEEDALMDAEIGFFLNCMKVEGYGLKVAEAVGSLDQKAEAPLVVAPVIEEPVTEDVKEEVLEHFEHFPGEEGPGDLLGQEVANNKIPVDTAFDECFGAVIQHADMPKYSRFKTEMLIWENTGSHPPELAIMHLLPVTKREHVWRATCVLLTSLSRWVERRKCYFGKKVVEQEYAHLRRRIKTAVFGPVVTHYKRI